VVAGTVKGIICVLGLGLMIIGLVYVLVHVIHGGHDAEHVAEKNCVLGLVVLLEAVILALLAVYVIRGVVLNALGQEKSNTTLLVITV
jgi:hypothetical protein